MKIRGVAHSNRRHMFDVRLGTRTLPFPYAKADPLPTRDDAVVAARADEELGREGFVYTLASGKEGTVLTEQVLEYNRDPRYLRDLLLYHLTVDAQKRIALSALSKREIIRRLHSSPAQLYRLLDQTNYRKSVDQMLGLLQALDCDVELIVRPKTA